MLRLVSLGWLNVRCCKLLRVVVDCCRHVHGYCGLGHVHGYYRLGTCTRLLRAWSMCLVVAGLGHVFGFSWLGACASLLLT